MRQKNYEKEIADLQKKIEKKQEELANLKEKYAEVSKENAAQKNQVIIDAMNKKGISVDKILEFINTQA